MIKIYKYSVPGHCEGPIRQVLQVKMQYGKPVVWVMLDDSIKDVRALDFYTVGTGWELTGGDEEVVKQSAYVGTVKDEEGYIWHCFAVAVEPEKKNEGSTEDKEDSDAVAASPIGESDAEDALHAVSDKTV